MQRGVKGRKEAEQRENELRAGTEGQEPGLGTALMCEEFSVGSQDRNPAWNAPQHREGMCSSKETLWWGIFPCFHRESLEATKKKKL